MPDMQQLMSTFESQSQLQELLLWSEQLKMTAHTEWTSLQLLLFERYTQALVARRPPTTNSHSHPVAFTPIQTHSLVG